MRVYRLVFETDDYQSLIPEDENIWETDVLDMDCTPKSEKWVPPKVRVYNPRKRRGHFFRLASSAMVISADVCERLQPQLDFAGELLPLEWRGGEGYLLNVLECVDCLDHDRTEWVYRTADDGRQIRLRIKKHVFMKHLVPEATIFKIPENYRAYIYILERCEDSEDEFKSMVELNNLEGISFKLVWESED